MESTSRPELFKDFQPGGRYGDIIGIYHEYRSEEAVGQPDRAMIEALPSSCKWLAHKGAGYDSIDITAAKEKGEPRAITGSLYS